MPCPNDARVRSKTMAFRCTPEEYEMIGRMAEACGMNKQEYIMARLSEKEIVVMSSSRTRKAMKEWIGALTKDLIRESHAGHLSERLDEQLTIMLKYFNSLCAAEKSQSDQVAAPSRTRTEATQVQHDWSRILALNKN